MLPRHVCTPGSIWSCDQNSCDYVPTGHYSDAKGAVPIDVVALWLLAFKYLAFWGCCLEIISCTFPVTPAPFSPNAVLNLCTHIQAQNASTFYSHSGCQVGNTLEKKSSLESPLIGVRF